MNIFVLRIRYWSGIHEKITRGVLATIKDENTIVTEVTKMYEQQFHNVRVTVEKEIDQEVICYLPI